MKLAFVLSLLVAPVLLAGEQTALDAEVKAHRAARAQFEPLRQTNPKKYVEASLAWIEKLYAIGEKHRDVSQSVGARSDAMSEMMKLGAFARSRLREPRLAIDFYQRAARMQQALRGGDAPIAMNDRIADIEQFDLGDRKAAAKHLRELLATTRVASGEYASYSLWMKRWLETEIAFLEQDHTFAGSLNAQELAGFAMYIYAGVGAEMANGDPIDRELNPFAPPQLSAAELEKKLLPLPASHANFLRYYLFAVRMSPEALRTWLARNDPAGFWRASLLTFGAVADRNAVRKSGEGGDFHVMLVRTKDGASTGLATLSREYAKSHSIPKANEPKRRATPE